MQKIVLLASAALVLALTGGAAVLWMQEPEAPQSPVAVQAAGADIGGPFELTAHTGERVTAEEVIDGPTLVYFGYTWCPDVCPVDTQVMVETVTLLAGQGIAVKPVFITVDPARDDVESLAYYAEAHHPEMVALTGSAEEIRAVADAYKVYYNRVDDSGSAAEYLMNHTAFTYLMTPDGMAALFRRALPPYEQAEAMAAEIARVLRSRDMRG